MAGAHGKVESTQRLVDDAEAIAAQGEWLRAVEMLSDASRALDDSDDPADRVASADLAAAALSLRHRGFAEHPIGDPPAGWQLPLEDRFPGVDSVPEIPARELDAEILSAALQHHGCILVRGLLEPGPLARIRADIDDAFEAFATIRRDGVAPPELGFRAFRADRSQGYELGVIERAFASHGSGVLGVDAPKALNHMIDALRETGVEQVMNDYFGEQPAFSVKKTTLRRTEPDAIGGWHQDGAFLGTETRSLNIWTALTPCGEDAPGLDVYARHFDHLVPTGGDETWDWAVSDETASTYGTENLVRPVFEAGDALFFDQMTLHRTGIGPGMTEDRYAIEMWFFAPSTYPRDQIPLLF